MKCDFTAKQGVALYGQRERFDVASTGRVQRTPKGQSAFVTWQLSHTSEEDARFYQTTVMHEHAETWRWPSWLLSSHGFLPKEPWNSHFNSLSPLWSLGCVAGVSLHSPSKAYVVNIALFCLILFLTHVSVFCDVLHLCFELIEGCELNLGWKVCRSWFCQAFLISHRQHTVSMIKQPLNPAKLIDSLLQQKSQVGEAELPAIRSGISEALANRLKYLRLKLDPKNSTVV